MVTPPRAPLACAHSHRSSAADLFTAPLALPVSTAAARPVHREGGRSASSPAARLHQSLERCSLGYSTHKSTVVPLDCTRPCAPLTGWVPSVRVCSAGRHGGTHRIVHASQRPRPLHPLTTLMTEREVIVPESPSPVLWRVACGVWCAACRHPSIAANGRGVDRSWRHAGPSQRRL
jgi:hypothetical protein